MKNNFCLLAIFLSAVLFFSSCEKDDKNTTRTTFEDLPLDEKGYYVGADGAGGFTAGNIYFPTSYSNEYGSWSGFAYTNHEDDTTRGFQNQFSSITGHGADGSEKYAVLYSYSSDTIEFLVPQKVTGISLSNTTYTYYTILEGNQFTDPFGGADGNEKDFFHLVMTGLDEEKYPVFKGTVVLADYTADDNAQDMIGDVWTELDLSDAGFLKYLVFSFESSDVGDYGINTPTYVCIDNIFGELQE